MRAKSWPTVSKVCRVLAPRDQLNMLLDWTTTKSNKTNTQYSHSSVQGFCVGFEKLVVCVYGSHLREMEQKLLYKGLVRIRLPPKLLVLCIQDPHTRLRIFVGAAPWTTHWARRAFQDPYKTLSMAPHKTLGSPLDIWEISARLRRPSWRQDLL